MPIVQLPNGQTVQFPDGTSIDTMQAALQPMLTAVNTPATAPSAAPARGLLDTIGDNITDGVASLGGGIIKGATPIAMGLGALGGKLAQWGNDIGIVPDSVNNAIDRQVVDWFSGHQHTQDTHSDYQPHTAVGKVADAVGQAVPVIAGTLLAPEAALPILAAQGTMSAGTRAIDQGDSLEDAQLKGIAHGIFDATIGKFIGDGAGSLIGKGSEAAGALLGPAVDSVGANLLRQFAQGAATTAINKPAGTAIDYGIDSMEGERGPDSRYDWTPSFTDLIAGGLGNIPGAMAAQARQNRMADAPSLIPDGSAAYSRGDGAYFPTPEAVAAYARANGRPELDAMPVTARMLDPDAASDRFLGYLARVPGRPLSDADADQDIPTPDDGPSPKDAGSEAQAEQAAETATQASEGESVQGMAADAARLLTLQKLAQQAPPGTVRDQLQQTINLIARRQAETTAAADLSEDDAARLATLQTLRDEATDTGEKSRLQAAIDSLVPARTTVAAPDEVKAAAVAGGGGNDDGGGAITGGGNVPDRGLDDNAPDTAPGGLPRKDEGWNDDVKLPEGIPAPVFKAGYSRSGLKNVPKDQRSEPETYLEQQYMDEHLKSFQRDGGGFLYTDADVADQNRKTFNPYKFIMNGNDLRRVIGEFQRTGDVAQLEKSLGYKPGSLANQRLYVKFLDNPKVKMATGTEGGANEKWRPGGVTWPGGWREAVLDNVPIYHGNNAENVEGAVRLL